jgi:hypothetical protein
VIVWLPLNWFEPVVAYEPVFEFNDAVVIFTLALNVFTDEVNVLSIEPLALTDAENEFILDVNVLNEDVVTNEPVPVTIAVILLSTDCE